MHATQRGLALFFVVLMLLVLSLLGIHLWSAVDAYRRQVSLQVQARQLEEAARAGLAQGVARYLARGVDAERDGVADSGFSGALGAYRWRVRYCAAAQVSPDCAPPPAAGALRLLAQSVSADGQSTRLVTVRLRSMPLLSRLPAVPIMLERSEGLPQGGPVETVGDFEAALRTLSGRTLAGWLMLDSGEGVFVEGGQVLLLRAYPPTVDGLPVLVPQAEAGSADAPVLLVAGQALAVPAGLKIHGLLVAPRIELAAGSHVVGALLAKTVAADASARVEYAQPLLEKLAGQPLRAVVPHSWRNWRG